MGPPAGVLSVSAVCANGIVKPLGLVLSVVLRFIPVSMYASFLFRFILDRFLLCPTVVFKKIYFMHIDTLPACVSIGNMHAGPKEAGKWFL